MTGCEVTILYPRTGLTWPWRWDWDAATRTLQTQDGSWTMRYDAAGRLIEDLRKTPAVRTELVYDDANSILRRRRVYREGKLDLAASFNQWVDVLESSRALELKGQTLQEQKRRERLEFDESGTLRHFVENGASVRTTYAVDGRLMRAVRPNGSEVVCSYSNEGILMSCQEDGTFDATNPQLGEALDGTPDVQWRFSEACRPLQKFALPYWFALPTVAPLSDCLRKLPPWRPADGCRVVPSYAITWFTNDPQKLWNLVLQPGAGKLTRCTEQPCYVGELGGFAFSSTTSESARFECFESGRGYSKNARAQSFGLGSVVDHWSCSVFFDLPPVTAPTSYVVSWRVVYDGTTILTPGIVHGEPGESCDERSCRVAPGSSLTLRLYPGQWAKFTCSRLGWSEPVREGSNVTLKGIRADWDCLVELQPV